MPDVPSTLRIAPGGRLAGVLRVPGDKSISHRAIMLGSLADGSVEVEGFLEGEDSLNTLQAFRAMGVSISDPAAGRVRIEGVGLHGLRAPDGPLDLGNSGTSMRLLAGLLAGQPFATTLAGDASLSRRPMGRVITPLRAMGARIDAQAGDTAPLTIHGGQALRAIDYRLPVASAQVKSAVLLAGLYAQGRTCVREQAVTRDHSERMLAAFGYPIEWSGPAPAASGGEPAVGAERLVCVDGGARLAARAVRVPADISSAAFFLVGASIAEGSELRLEGVGLNPSRLGVLHILSAMGAEIEIDPTTRVDDGEPIGDLTVRASALRGIDVPQELVPLAIDEFPALFVAAACAEGTTRLSGASELRVKESDRIQTMADGLRTLGVVVEPLPDGIVIEGRATLSGGEVHADGDHRVAMALAMAGLRATGDVIVRDAAGVATSFPGFVQCARSAGLEIAAEH